MNELEINTNSQVVLETTQPNQMQLDCIDCKEDELPIMQPHKSSESDMGSEKESVCNISMVLTPLELITSPNRQLTSQCYEEEKHNLQMTTSHHVYPFESSSPCSPSHSKKPRLSTYDNNYSASTPSVPGNIANQVVDCVSNTINSTNSTSFSTGNFSNQQTAPNEANQDEHVVDEDALTCIDTVSDEITSSQDHSSDSLQDSSMFIALKDMSQHDLKNNMTIDFMEYPGSILSTDFATQCQQSSFMVDYGRPGSSYTNPSTSSIGMSPQLCSPSLRNASKPLSHESCSLSSCTLADEEVIPPKQTASIQHSQIFCSSSPSLSKLPGVSSSHVDLNKFNENIFSESDNLVPPQLIPVISSSSYASSIEWRPSVTMSNNCIAVPQMQSNENKMYPYAMSSHTNGATAAACLDAISSATSHKHACSQCDKVFDTKAQIKAHELLHDPCHKFPCCYPNCDRSFKSESYLQNHIRRLHKNSKNIVCCHCDFSTAQKKAFDHHMLRSHKDCTIPCCVTGCPFRFRNQMQLMQHIDQNHTALEGSLQCPECSQAFSNEATLAVHRDQCFKTNISKSQTNLLGVQPAMIKAPSKMNATKPHPTITPSQDPYDFSKDSSTGFVEAFPLPGCSPQIMHQNMSNAGPMQRTLVDVREMSLNAASSLNSVSFGIPPTSSLECILDEVVQGSFELKFPSGSLNSSEQTIAEQVLVDVNHCPSKDNSFAVSSNSQPNNSIDKSNLTSSQKNLVMFHGSNSSLPLTEVDLVNKSNSGDSFVNYFPVHSLPEEKLPLRDNGSGHSEAMASPQHQQRFQPQGQLPKMPSMSAPNELGLDGDDLFSLMSEEDLIALEFHKGSFNPMENASFEKVMGSNEVSSSCATGLNNQSYGGHSNSLSSSPHAVAMNDHLRSLSHLGDKFLGGNATGSSTHAGNFPLQKSLPAAVTPTSNVQQMNPLTYHPLHKQQLQGASIPFEGPQSGQSGHINFADPRTWPNAHMRARFVNLNNVDPTGMAMSAGVNNSGNIPQTALRYPSAAYMENLKSHQAAFSRSISYPYSGAVQQEMHNPALLMRQQSAMNPYILTNADLNGSLGMVCPQNYTSQQEYLYQRNLHATMAMRKQQQQQQQQHQMQQQQRSFMSTSSIPNPFSHPHMHANSNCAMEPQIHNSNWTSVSSQQQHQAAMLMQQQQRIAMGVPLHPSQQGNSSSSQYVTGIGCSRMENGMIPSNSTSYYNHDNSAHLNGEFYGMTGSSASGFCVNSQLGKFPGSSLNPNGSGGAAVNQSTQPVLNDS